MIGLAFAAATAVCPDATLARAEYQGNVMNVLAERGVAILAGDPAAQQFIDKNADFSLVIGDVGGTLGTGPSGAAALSKKLDAVTYEYDAWTGIPMPADPCAKQKVEVRFFDKSNENGTAVTFEYSSGRLLSANAWNIGRIVLPFRKTKRN